MGCKSTLVKRKKMRPVPSVVWTMRKILFKQDENRNIEKYENCKLCWLAKVFMGHMALVTMGYHNNKQLLVERGA